MKIFKPEFGESNFIDLNVNTNFTISLTPTLSWAQLDKKLLYDHRSDRLLYTLGADDDSTTVTIKIDFQENIYLGLVKILNTNLKSGTIEISEDDVTYTTLKTITDNTLSSIHFNISTTFPGSVFEDEYLLTEDGEYLLTEDGERILLDGNNRGRYLKITITETQDANDEKHLGELYVGRQAMRLEQGRVLDYNDSFRDVRKSVLFGSDNYLYSVHRNSVNNISMIYKTTNVSEINFLKDIVRNGGIFEFFPTGGDFGSDLDADLSINDIYLITATGFWNKKPWGRSAEGIVSLTFGETRAI